jgi:Ser/Thr protein kinase RdoA (MazF antagonist)
MMKLSVMQALVETVEHDGRSTVADAILRRWSHTEGTARFVRASANFLFTFQNAGRAYFLRFNHASERTAAYIQAEVDYLHHLAGQGIPVARPMRPLSGNDVEQVDTPQGRFQAVVFEALPWQHVALQDLTLDQLATWGAALGKLHLSAQSYTGAGRPTWSDHLAWVAENLPLSEIAARKTLESLEYQLQKLPIHAQNFGLIHYDFELDNILWNAGDLGIIDFDDCAWYWFAADIAYALRDLFDDAADRVNLDQTQFLAFVQGYRSAKEIDQEELELIPLFLRMHHLAMFARLLRALGSGAQPNEPDWLARLREKLLAKIAKYREGFSRYVLFVDKL